MIALAPAGAADESGGHPLGGPPGQDDTNPHGDPPGQNGTHPHDGPPGQDDGHPEQGGQGDDAPEDESGEEANGTEPESFAAQTATRGCRLVEWDGGGVEPALNPLLGILVIDPQDCLTGPGGSTQDSG